MEGWRCILWKSTCYEFDTIGGEMLLSVCSATTSVTTIEKARKGLLTSGNCPADFDLYDTGCSHIIVWLCMIAKLKISYRRIHDLKTNDSICAAIYHDDPSIQPFSFSF